MRTALDSNILSAFWSNEPTAAAIARKLSEAKRQGSLVLSPVAYVELFAHPTMNEAFREDFFRQMDIAIDFDMTTQALGRKRTPLCSICTPQAEIRWRGSKKACSGLRAGSSRAAPGRSTTDK